MHHVAALLCHRPDHHATVQPRAGPNKSSVFGACLNQTAVDLGAKGSGRPIVVGGMHPLRCLEFRRQLRLASPGSRWATCIAQAPATSTRLRACRYQLHSAGVLARWVGKPGWVAARNGRQQETPTSLDTRWRWQEPAMQRANRRPYQSLACTVRQRDAGCQSDWCASQIATSM